VFTPAEEATTAPGFQPEASRPLALLAARGVLAAAESQLGQHLESLGRYREMTVAQFDQINDLGQYHSQGLVVRKWSNSKSRYSLSLDCQKRLDDRTLGHAILDPQFT
jgi:hypothetical protein